MRIPFQVDLRSATPIYDQVVSQVKYALAAGSIQPGTALPSVRRLAVQLQVNHNTVARAYRELEREGIVETRRGQGTFATEQAKRLSPPQRKSALGPAADRLVAEARTLGLSREELNDTMNAAWARLDANSPRSKPGRTS